MPDYPSELKKGEPATKNWRAINEQLRIIKRLDSEMRRLSSAIADLRNQPNFKEGGGGGTKLARFDITAVADDTITGTRASDGASIVIAKPYFLRVSTWKGKTIGNWSYDGSSESRNASYAGTPVNAGLQTGQVIAEILDPAYSGAKEIVAAEIESGTGVAGVSWMDLNADARRFVAKRELVEVCKVINGLEQQKKVILEGGPLF